MSAPVGEGVEQPDLPDVADTSRFNSGTDSPDQRVRAGAGTGATDAPEPRGRSEPGDDYEPV